MLKNNEGFSINCDGEVPTGGFMVSTNKATEYATKVEDLTVWAVAHYIEKHLYELINPTNYLGGWVDDGMAYLDISTNVPTIEEATDLGYVANQKAIWDVVNQESIYLQ
jgi:hypothetical protein